MSPVRLDLLHSFNQPWQTDTNMLALLNHMRENTTADFKRAQHQW